MTLPPLNALKAFEAAARLHSFARAADELNVSPGAISRHVRQLEDNLGVSLFKRMPQGVAITPHGAILAQETHDAFQTISAAISNLPTRHQRLRLVAPPTFANRLLIPRLTDFNKLRPRVSISVGILLNDVSQLNSPDIDCGIYTAQAQIWPANIKSALIKHEELTPVCAPSFLARLGTKIEAEDLGRQTCLHIANCPSDWPLWARKNGLSRDQTPNDGPNFETAELAIRAAVEGLGVTIMDRFLIENELADGRLVDLFPESVPVDNGYYFFCDKVRWSDPVIASFRKWLIGEFK